MATNALKLAAVASRITTIGQVRAAMGAVTLTLSQGYAKLDELTTIADVQSSARALLDVVNKSASILYGIYNDDPDLQDEEITAAHAASAGRIMAEGNDALKVIEDATKQNLFDIGQVVSDALDAIKDEAVAVGNAVGATVQGLTNAAAAGLSAFAWAAWPTLLVVGALGVAYVYRARLVAALKGIG
jgi:hypothetical protein